jgi:hypothetical protein
MCPEFFNNMLIDSGHIAGMARGGQMYARAAALERISKKDVSNGHVGRIAKVSIAALLVKFLCQHYRTFAWLVRRADHALAC